MEIVTKLNDDVNKAINSGFTQAYQTVQNTYKRHEINAK